MKRLLFALLILAAGCASAPHAPPVDQVMVELATERGMDPGGLENGRRLYLTRCTGCHGSVQLDRYDPIEWLSIMDRMAHQAGLDPAQRDEVEDYLTLARSRNSLSREREK